MAIRQYPHAMQSAALKWRELAERRRAHFIELFRSGRWKHYYTKEEFSVQLRDAIDVADRWARIAPRREDFAQAAE